MTQIEDEKPIMPANRIEAYLDKSHSQTEWESFSLSEKDLPDLFFLNDCYHDYFVQPKIGKKTEYQSEVADWTKLAQRLVERLSLENRIEIAEKNLKNLSSKLSRIEALCEKALEKSILVAISTFAPEPFELVRDFSIVLQPEEGGYVASLFDANISSSGDTQEEAIANVKDLILMIFKGFEDEDEGDLGPTMIRQKHALLSLIRRK